jgi:23S rRNA pseudouridine1911/1915/1917 synthase
MKTTAAQTFHVPPESPPQTVAAALRGWLPGESWTKVKKLIAARHVQINGNLCVDEGRRLKAGDVVKVLPYPQAAPPQEQDVKIRFLDPHLVIVEKPSGMTTLRHSEERSWPARRKQLQPTLDEILPRILARRAKQRPGERNAPPAVRAVHRLDRDTSGLMVFARTVPAERHLVRQFSKHTITRAYLAVAHGDVKKQTIETTLVRDRGDGRRGSKEDTADGQRAVTHVQPLERLGDYTLVECRLETGRTHQIRIHLSERGHVVCGEKVYNQPLRGKPLIDRSGAPRLALHAAELGLVHPVTGEAIHFTMPLPRDLAEFVQRLRSAT